jgi:branched-chain amino acid transport system permease protein
MQNTSVMFLTMLLFGGMGNFWGAIVGATTLSLVSEWLQGLGTYQMLVYGVFLLIIVVFIPSGVTRGRNPVELISSAYKKRKGRADHAENR